METRERDNENPNLKRNVSVLILNVEFDGLIVCRKKPNDKVKETPKPNTNEINETVSLEERGQVSQRGESN